MSQVSQEKPTLVPPTVRSPRVARLTAVAAGALLALGCAVPGLVGAGGGPLVVDALAVTAKDAETGNTGYKVYLRWTTPPNARLFEIVRQFGDQPGSVKASQESTNWTDESLAAEQTASYAVRALGADSKALTISDQKAITVLKNEVGKPGGLKPADNAVIGVDEVPMLSWEPVDTAAWYYVRVVRADNEGQVYAALTRNTSIKLGEASPLKFEKFLDLYGVGGESSLSRGVVHRWSVSAIRTTGTDDPNKATAIDVTPSAVQRFIPGG